MAHLRTVIWTTFFLLLANQSACAADTTFRGKLIDAETLQPIEGAVVVAVWRKTKAFLIASTTDFKDAKETLTDKNGEWSITGPEGQDVPDWPEPLYVVGLRHITGSPEIIYYKPGYRSTTRGGFSAYPYIDRERNLEGIVLNRPGETREEMREHYEQCPRDSFRFIPVKDPEKKLRELDFSFQYPENLQIIQRKSWVEVDHNVIGSPKAKIKEERLKADYKVIGLRKAKTREERLRAQPTPPSINIDELPILYKLINEENKGFGLKPIGRRKAK